jgi:uncharacterized damage-inducible protein DinB
MICRMTWTVPTPERTDPVLAEAERPMLVSWLDYHRQTLLFKCAGLTAEQLKQASAPPSNLTLLGLVRHMADVERAWFRRRANGEQIGFRYCGEGNWDGDFDDVPGADAQADLAAYAEELAVIRALEPSLALEKTFYHDRWAETINVRWVYLHMIEEYARHNGHADLLRERIDGVTGD